MHKRGTYFAYPPNRDAYLRPLSPRRKFSQLVLVVGGAGGGEEQPDEVHGRDGEGSISEAEEEVGDDDEDILGMILAGRGGDLRLGGEEGHGMADLVRARRQTRR